jgi:hypothetical protein
MLVCTSIIAQPIEAQGNKNFLCGNYAGKLCEFARSVVAIVGDSSDHPLAASGHLGLGLDPPWVDRGHPLGAPDRRVGIDRLQPIIHTLHGATDLGLGVWRVKEPLDLPRDFRL